MKNTNNRIYGVLLIILSCMFGFMKSNACDEVNSLCKLAGYKIQNNDFRNILKNIILTDRDNCNDYSLDWTYVVTVYEDKSKKEYEIIVYSLELKSDRDFLMKSDRELGCIFAFGHLIMLVGDFQETGLFKAIGKSYEFENNSSDIFNSFPDGPETKYRFNKITKEFDAINNY